MMHEGPEPNGPHVPGGNPGPNATWLQDLTLVELRRIVDVLYRVHHLIAVMTDLDMLLEQVMEESKSVAQAEACSLLLYDPGQEELYFNVALGESGDQQRLKNQVRLNLGQGIAGAAAESRQSIIVEDVSADPRFFKAADSVSSFQTRSILAVPLVDHENLIGVLEVLNKRDGGHFSEADLRVMEIFSRVVATAIANARLIEENLRAERLAAIGEAVAGVSHYAKNILTGLNASVDLLSQGVEKKDDAVISRGVPVLRRSATRIANFVEDMLAFSKPRQPMRERCEIAPLIEEVKEVLFDLLVRRDVELMIDVEEAPEVFYVDSRAVFRALLNLLKNAADAVPVEAGKIGIVAKRTDQGDLEVTVFDNGPGIPRELRDAVCDPFFSTKGTQGTGLGLAVTSKIVKEHGGTLHIEDGPGGGASFRIVLPPHAPIG